MESPTASFWINRPSCLPVTMQVNCLPAQANLCTSSRHRTHFSRVQPTIISTDLEQSLTPYYVILTAFKCPLLPHAIKQNQAPSLASRLLLAVACGRLESSTSSRKHLCSFFCFLTSQCQHMLIALSPILHWYSQSPTTSSLSHPLNFLFPGFQPQTKLPHETSCYVLTLTMLL